MGRRILREAEIIEEKISTFSRSLRPQDRLSIKINQMKKIIISPWVWIPTILVTAFFFSIPYISDWITAKSIYAKYASKAAPIMIRAIQEGLVYPFGKYISSSKEALIIFPYWFLVFFTIRLLYVKTQKIWKWIGLGIAVLYLFLYCFPDTLLLLDNDQASRSSGTVSNGQLENAKRVPFRGDNFTTYAFWGYLTGRTFAHDKVKATILDAYDICIETCPETTFALGEIGFCNGGRFIPHITHQNGLSVDFMTPMLKDGKPYHSHHLLNIWGYGWEFDKKGHKDNVQIDYETSAKHIYALKQAAKKHGLRIKKVIFDPVLRPYLLKTEYGKKIKNLPYTRNRVIIRHDDHYHIDFEVL